MCFKIVRRHLCQVVNPLPREIVRIWATSVCSHSIPELCLLTLVSFRARSGNFLTTPKSQRRANSITKCSYICLWNVLDSLNGYTNQISFPQVADQLWTLAKLAPRLHCRTRQQRRSRGVHSVLRSGVEQRSFAHTVLPLGALPLLLSEVERKQRALNGLDQGVSRMCPSRLGAAFFQFSLFFHFSFFILSPF